jgi:hypothetical protein
MILSSVGFVISGFNCNTVCQLLILYISYTQPNRKCKFFSEFKFTETRTNDVL